MIPTLATSQGASFQVDAEDVPLLARFTWLWVRTLTRGKYMDFGVLSSLSIGGHPPEEAARAYDKVVEEVRGPRARLNFPQEHRHPLAAAIKGP
jgi:hypothetical protein